MFVVAFSSLLENDRSFSAFRLVVRRPYDAGTDTCPCFSSLFSFVEITLGRMPILTRRSRASTFQEVFAWLSKNSVSLTSASDASFLDALRPRVIDGSEGVAAFGVGFCARSLLSYRKLHFSPFEQSPFSFHW